VLRLLATGANNAEIASDLSLSTRTIEVHVGNILRKLGVRSRGAAVAEAMQAGYLGPDDLEPRSTT
jgi:DNA-binding NarL/FixJ family response regulator